MKYKDVLNYKKLYFWIVCAAILVIVFGIIYFTNPRNDSPVDEPDIPEITLEMLDNAPTKEVVDYEGIYEENMIWLLGKDDENDVSLYSITENNYILRIGDEIYILEDELGGPQYFGTEFSMTDLDGDGDKEFALIVLKGTGTGCLQTEISVYEKDNDRYIKNAPDYDLYLEEITEWFKEQNPDIDNFVFGDIYETRISGNNIAVTFSPGFMTEGRSYPEYSISFQDYDVLANIEYSEDGSFSLKNIRPINTDITYQDIIDAAREALSGRSYNIILGNDLGISPEFCGTDHDNLQFGYAIMDINNDGVEELIFGVNPVTENPYWKGYVYDIYTMYDGKVVQLANGLARYHWFICKDNMIVFEVSEDGFSMGWEYWDISNSTYMWLKETVIEQDIFDENWESETLWLYSDKLSYEYHNSYELYDIITEEEAQKIRDKYEYIYPEFTPF